MTFSSVRQQTELRLLVGCRRQQTENLGDGFEAETFLPFPRWAGSQVDERPECELGRRCSGGVRSEA